MMGKWDQRRRRPRHRKVIRPKRTEVNTDRQRRIRTTEQKHADELSELDREMRLKGQW